jgi:diacylglycerol kinase family enzyme
MDINGIKFDDFSSLAFIVNFKDTCKFKLGIDMLKEYQGSSAKKTRILIGGGDEMIINCIEDLRNNAIDLTRCLFGVIPIGFTNNLSKTLQFNNNSQIGTDMKYFKTLLESYNKAKEVEIDIWKLDLTLHVT